MMTRACSMARKADGAPGVTQQMPSRPADSFRLPVSSRRCVVFALSLAMLRSPAVVEHGFDVVGRG